MSGFIGGTGANTIIGNDDERLDAPWFRADVDIGQEFPEAFEDPYTTPWWPGTGGLTGDAGDVGANLFRAAAWNPQYESGPSGAAAFGFVGVTRDQNGTAVPGVTVTLFRTSDNTVQDVVVSDPQGNFLLHTAYYPDFHYLVAYRAGAPDIQGTTVNTLIGA